MKNIYAQARFLTSAAKPSQAPTDTGAEVAFAGRSNAGKSSALNVITNQTKLARTSKTPGRTQLLNFFQINDEDVRLVDLPGYGFAKVPLAVKRNWEKALSAYLETRKSLKGMILLCDVRRGLTEYDQQMILWCDQAGLRVHILLTKSDKLKKGPAKASLLATQRLLPSLHASASVQLFSALKKTGLDEARRQLDQWLFARDVQEET